MSIVKHGQKSVRVVLTDSMYSKLKETCPEHGDLSKLIRNLLRKYLSGLSDELSPEAPVNFSCPHCKSTRIVELNPNEVRCYSCNRVSSKMAATKVGELSNE